jgi:hypothetical protein
LIIDRQEASMLTGSPSKNPTARRQQHRSARDKAGIEVWPLPVRAHRFINYLLLTTRVTEAQALNPRSCRAAAAKLLDDLARLADDPQAVARMIETLKRHLQTLTREF